MRKLLFAALTVLAVGSFAIAPAFAGSTSPGNSAQGAENGHGNQSQGASGGNNPSEGTGPHAVTCGACSYVTGRCGPPALSN